MKKLFKKIVSPLKKVSKPKNFADYSEKEKAEIIKKSVEDANKLQMKLVKEYEKKFATV